MRIEKNPDCGNTTALVNGEPETNALLAKTIEGFSIEELILSDAQAQRRLGKALRKLQREQRRRLVEKAAKKMKDAANDRFWSAFAGALVNVGVAASGLLQGPLENAIGTAGSKAVIDGLCALGSGFAKFTPLDMTAAEKDADAKIIQEEAQARGENANDAGEWLAAARALERKMIDRLEQIARTEHEGRISVMNRFSR